MRSRWAVRLVALAALLVWLGLAGVGGPLVGRLSEVQKNDNASFLPAKAESTEVMHEVARFSDTESLPFILVMEGDGKVGPAQQAAAQKFVAALPDRELDLPGDPALSKYLTETPQAAIPSQDGAALLLVVPMNAVTSAETIGDTSPLFAAADTLRAAAKADLAPSGLTTYVTGPGGVTADFVTAFAGIDGILLGVALGVVFIILLVVYRSPILPFAVLLTAVFGLAAAALAVFPLAKNDVIGLSGQSQGILSILVVGAATDYALLLVSRYKEELHDEASTWVAMKRAWRGAVEPIAASAATVILGLLCLLLSDLGNTSGLGPVGALGIAGALVSALTFLPAVLLLIGRAAFWPAVPKLDHVHAQDKIGTRGLWGRVAALVGSHPRRTWVLTLTALLALAAFVPTLKADGISQSDLFLDKVESVTGQEVLAKHFPAGSGSPIQVVAPEGKTDAVLAALGREDGVNDPYAGAAPGAPAKVVDGKVLVQATLTEAADSPAATDVVKRLRTDLDSVGDDVRVGGQTAMSLDVLDASNRDLRTIIPAILLVIFVVLALLLRSLVAPLLLVVANVVSFGATMGVAAIAFNHVFDFPGSDPSTPLYGFVFLVALGIDYSIFLMTRVREEAAEQGTRRGILVGLAVTGGVITSAGVVLASTFSALAVLPILFLVQIAFIVAFGVLLDTLVVRSLLVPALSHDIGRRIWAPSALSRGKE
ncbi:putative drug exporter of the RND superfamily [Pedococcus dokdonensis]|uniref:Putative drug exporter of the RND superfamily n=1 Tax=Pedococcus dokdonensis TaxID=443156 RepID=A0A1H0MPL5_9MICO|nr:MMPL family transporter [Pedococcus dokdonensis]SDO82399.1 putative drug exporter of the RND superfamily [Pedococcus dokdonensis]